MPIDGVCTLCKCHNLCSNLFCRTLPKPKLPVGPSHKFAFNYYKGRDGRRESAPAMVVMSCQKALTAFLEVPAKRPVTPGNVLSELTLSTDQPYP
uniref:NADH dehydrogenase [ubiquinone] 1 alpha subcomplex subunit 7 n=1 Tax=Oncorhynchus tshawytscha TaxID=74940 RepID=A0A8C8I9C5_ONCTS